MPDRLFTAQSIEFAYKPDTPVLRGVDFHVDSGELVTLIGPNGSGKSTLLKLLAGLIKPQNGSIEFAGQPVGRGDPLAFAREVAYLPQEDEIHFPFSVGEVVMLGRWPHSGGAFFDSKSDRDASADAMKLAGIEDWGARQITELSGGERARVMLAKAVATQPRCFLLDEPASELDLKYRSEVYKLLRTLADSRRGIVVVAHDVGAVARWSNRLVLLANGRVIADGSPDDVLTQSILKEAYGIDVKVISDGPDRAVFASIGGDDR
jgi:iron complex transport system ATP-binding protein